VKKVVVVILGMVLLGTGALFGQKYDYHWLIGDGGSAPNNLPILGINDIDFNVQTPNVTRQHKTISIANGSGNISNRSGLLQFYTNGYEIRNVNDQTMQNGSGLSPGPLVPPSYGDCYPTSHGPLFLVKPDNDSVYYVFHIAFDTGTVYGLYRRYLFYTIVDMRLGGGLGEVLSKNNVLTDDSLATGWGITACKHANGRDWWIIVPEAGNNCFYKYLLTPSKIDSFEKQCIGDTVHIDTDRGSSVFTPNGTKYIWSNPIEHLNILDFDRCSGIFSNHRRYKIIDSLVLANGGIYVDGVGVSGSSKYLYLSTATEIRQFDLEADSIKNTEIIIANTLQNNPKTSVMFCQLAPDGKIYVCPNAQDTFLHVINYPDSDGLSCGFVKNALRLPCYNNFSLPYYPSYKLGAQNGSGCDTLSVGIKEKEKEKLLSLFPNPATDYVVVDYGFTDWSKGDVELEISNELGQLMHQQKLPRYSGFQKIDVSRFSNGFYTASIKRGDSVVAVGKFAKE
jgi:hypothetical protein